MASSTSPDTKASEFSADTVAMGAVFSAAVFVGTTVHLPVGIGFLNFGEIIIYTAAFLFGPIIGGLAGVGATFADIALGYTFFAPVTFVVKGLEGIIVGHISGQSRVSRIIAVAVGAPIMIVGYFLTVAYLQGIPIAIATELPIDILQAVVGLVVAIQLAESLEARLPRISASHKTPTEGSEQQVISAFLWMGFLSILLFWLPVAGPSIAGIVGGRNTDSVRNVVIAAVLPAFIAGGALFFVVTTFGLPLIGAIISEFVTIVAVFSGLALIAGAAIGNRW